MRILYNLGVCYVFIVTLFMCAHRPFIALCQETGGPSPVTLGKPKIATQNTGDSQADQNKVPNREDKKDVNLDLDDDKEKSDDKADQTTGQIEAEGENPNAISAGTQISGQGSDVGTAGKETGLNSLDPTKTHSSHDALDIGDKDDGKTQEQGLANTLELEQVPLNNHVEDEVKTETHVAGVSASDDTGFQETRERETASEHHDISDNKPSTKSETDLPPKPLPVAAPATELDKDKAPSDAETVEKTTGHVGEEVKKATPAEDGQKLKDVQDSITKDENLGGNKIEDNKQTDEVRKQTTDSDPQKDDKKSETEKREVNKETSKDVKTTTDVDGELKTKEEAKQEKGDQSKPSEVKKSKDTPIETSEGEQKEPAPVKEETKSLDETKEDTKRPDEAKGDTKTEGHGDVKEETKVPPGGKKDEESKTPAEKEQEAGEPEEKMPSFDEWKEKMLQEEEMKKKEQGQATKPASPPARTKFSLTENSKNHASSDCGAKLLLTNKEAQSPSAILNINPDLYMLNPCTAKIKFIVELCEPIQVKQIEIANYELFSSVPESFKVSISDRYPAREWHQLGIFQARNERVLQSFPLPHDEQMFAKYMKFEMLTFFGSEHYCPLSVLRVFGTNVVEEIEDADAGVDIGLDSTPEFLPPHPTPLPDDDKQKNGILESARDVVIGLVQRAAKVLAGREDSDWKGEDLPCFPEDAPNNSQGNGSQTDSTELPFKEHLKIYMPSMHRQCVGFDADLSKIRREVCRGHSCCFTPNYAERLEYCRKRGKGKDANDAFQCCVDERKCGLHSRDEPVAKTDIKIDDNSTTDFKGEVDNVIDSKKKLVETDEVKTPQVDSEIKEPKNDAMKDEKKDMDAKPGEEKAVIDSLQPRGDKQATPAKSQTSASNPPIPTIDNLIINVSSLRDIRPTESFKPAASSNKVQSSSGRSTRPPVVASKPTVPKLEPTMDVNQGKSVLDKPVEKTPSLDQVGVNKDGLDMQKDKSQNANSDDSKSSNGKSDEKLGDKGQPDLKPVEKSDKPVEKTLKPVEKATEQDEKSAQQIEKMTKEDETTTKPAETIIKPVDKIITPVDNVIKPVEKTTKSVEKDQTEQHSKPVVKGEVPVKSPDSATKQDQTVKLPKINGDSSSSGGGGSGGGGGGIFIGQQKESVFMRLNNRIKDLELNMSLSSRYLEELSQRYRKQMEEMQKSFTQTISKLTENAQTAHERDDEQLKYIRKLETQVQDVVSQLANTTQRMDAVIREVVERHLFLMFIEIFVMSLLFLFCIGRRPSKVYIPVENGVGVSHTVKLHNHLRHPIPAAAAVPYRRGHVHSSDESEGRIVHASPRRRNHSFGERTTPKASATNTGGGSCDDLLIIGHTTPFLEALQQGNNPNEPHKRKSKHKSRLKVSKSSSATALTNGNHPAGHHTNENQAGLLFKGSVCKTSHEPSSIFSNGAIKKLFSSNSIDRIEDLSSGGAMSKTFESLPQPATHLGPKSQQLNKAKHQKHDGSKTSHVTLKPSSVSTSSLPAAVGHQKPHGKGADKKTKSSPSLQQLNVHQAGPGRPTQQHAKKQTKKTSPMMNGKR